MPGRSDLRALARDLLRAASLPETVVWVRARAVGHTRWFHEGPTTAGESERVDVHVTAAMDGRSASVRGVAERLADARALLSEAEALARLAPKDPEHVPPVGAVKVPRVRRFDRRLAAAGPEGRRKLVAPAIERALARGVQPSGFCRVEVQRTVVADSAGLDAYDEGTEIALSLTCRTPDGTGSSKGGVVSHRLRGIDPAALGERVAAAAERARAPRPIDPGRYTVVLAPEAAADLLAFLRVAMSLRAAEEGRSAFSAPGGRTKIGERLFDERVTIGSDPADPRHPSSPLGPGGYPVRRTVWVDRGRLVALPVGRAWAARRGLAPRPMGSSMFVAGGKGDAQSLVRTVQRGIYVTRFWYNRVLAARSLTVTGMTRDGTFWIEDGAIAHPIKNLRYNESPLRVLANLVALGTPVRSGLSRAVLVVPPMVVRDFTFSSTSDAV